MSRSSDNSGPGQGATHWQGLLSRLSRVSAAMSETMTQSAERTREILDERARLMAQLTTKSRDGEPAIEIVEFSLAGQRCALPTRYVSEVLPLPGCTLLPGVPRHFRGVCNLRGQILLVADLAQLFGFAAPPAQDLQDLQAPDAQEPQLLVLGVGRPELGLVTHGACKTALLAESAISYSWDLATLAIGPLSQGITSDGLILLEGQSLLRDPRLFINQT